jgi:hypothetical protein
MVGTAREQGIELELLSVERSTADLTVLEGTILEATQGRLDCVQLGTGGGQSRLVG